MHVDDFSQSRFFGKSDCREPVWLTIKGEGTEMVKQQNGPDRKETVLHFVENDKPFILKSTNAQLIGNFTGIKYSEKWEGIRVQMWVDESVDFGGKIVGGVRVKQAINPQGRPMPQQDAPPSSTFQPPPEFDPAPPKDDDVPF